MTLNSRVILSCQWEAFRLGTLVCNSDNQKRKKKKKFKLHVYVLDYFGGEEKVKLPHPGQARIQVTTCVFIHYLQQKKKKKINEPHVVCGFFKEIKIKKIVFIILYEQYVLLRASETNKEKEKKKIHLDF